MKKIIEFYDKLAEKLCNIGSDKYLHLLFGLLIGIFASLIFSATTKGCMEISYATCGAIAATIVMLLKEIVDFFRGGNFDIADWLFGLLIGIFASLIFSATTKGCMEISYATCGAIAATIVMLLKEIVDFFRGGNFDIADWLFGIIGGVIGALLYLIIS